MGRSQAETVDVEGVPADPTGRPEQSDAPLAEQTAQSRSAGGALASWLPRQHGAWSILLVGYLLGTLAFEGRGGAVPWLVLASVLVGFVGQHSTVTALRARGTHRRAAVLAAAPLNGIAVGLMAVLIFAYGVRPLLPVVVLGSLLALVSLLVQHYHRDRTAWGELVGILGLSTVIPVASVCRTGGPYGPHIGLWLLGLLYFCGSVFHVRFLVRSWRARRGPFVKRLRAGWASAVYHPTAILPALPI